MNDLTAGTVPFAVLGLAPVLPLIRDSRFVPLAVTQATRSPALPDTPTLNETVLPGFAAAQWVGLAAPPGFPEAIAGRISDALELAVWSKQ